MVGTSNSAFPFDMTIDEISCFRKLLSHTKTYIEFGCGGSTANAIEIGVPKIYSIESDISWIDKLKENDYIENAIRFGQLTFIHANIGPTAEWGHPVGKSHLSQWPNYYLSIWNQLPTDPDLVFIDGRFRVCCALITFLLTPPECLVAIHDYSNRPQYHILEKYSVVLERIDKLIVLKRNTSANTRDIILEACNYLFNPS
jgi:hypothetical protein